MQAIAGDCPVGGKKGLFDGMPGLARAFTFNGTVNPGTIKVITRTTSLYGEDVTFTVTAGKTVHHGRATVLYPLRPQLPGLVTEMVFDS